jgi:hypothetical protein
MGIHSIKPGQIAVGNASQPVTPKTSKKRSTEDSPSLKVRSTKAAKSSAASTPILKSHSEPRVQLRKDTASVHLALGANTAVLDGIDPQRLPGFYKHANMIVNGQLNDKSFLLECLINLYLSAPDSSHPNAIDPEWVDDQDVLWGDELLFLFEAAPQLDQLDLEGKRLFANSLAARAGTDRQRSGSVDVLEQALNKVSRRMALADTD